MRKCVTEMSPYKINKDLYKIEVAREYNGIVIKKGRDRYNHNFSFFNLNDSTEISNEDLITSAQYFQQAEGIEKEQIDKEIK